MVGLRIWKRKDMDPGTLAPLVMAEAGLMRDVEGSRVDLFKGMSGEPRNLIGRLGR